MKFFKIEVDEEMWLFLKRHAEPFEDTPNTVLRRLLLPENRAANHGEGLILPPGLPKALAQVLEVIYEVRKIGRSRSDATNVVARRRGTAPQTILDKYCRQLNKRANEIDKLLAEPALSGFQRLLEQKFVGYGQDIEGFFATIRK